MRRSLLPFGCLLAALLAPLRAEAHGLEVVAKLQGERVAVAAFYDDDTPARTAKVHVEDAARQVVAEGYTDADGRWSFARPQPGVYRVFVDAGAGHRQHVDIPIPGDGESPAVDTPESDRPHRTQLTRVHWPQIALGLAVIAGVGVMAWGILRWRQPNR